MSKTYKIQDTSLTNIANEIRNIYSLTEQMSTNKMIDNLIALNEDVEEQKILTERILERLNSF